LVLSNPYLSEAFIVEHLDTSDHRSGANIGRWDLANLRHGGLALLQLLRTLRGQRGIVYLPLSQSTPAFMRDSLFIQVATAMRWKVAIHLRGSEFARFVEAVNPALRWWIRFTLSRVVAAAVMGEALRNVFRGYISSDRISVVPNGTPEPRLGDVERDPHHVLFLSNLLRRKGVVESVEAALLVLDDVPEARFSFVGAWEDAQLEKDLRGRVASANGSIEFHGPVHGPAKDRLLGSAAVLLFPPVEPEGHPRVVIEALAAALPVVTTDRGAIAESVADEETGYVLDNPDPRELAACVTRLLRDQDLRMSMATAARRRYLDLFTQDQADTTLACWLSSSL
jgi:glycosyltransferase involved in cell wall biosynthesis